MAPAFAIFHIPHSSTVVPAHVRGSLCLLEKDLAHELFSMTDHYTDELFDYQFEPVHRTVFPVSRLVLDPERFSDDALEPMAEKGMGKYLTPDLHIIDDLVLSSLTPTDRWLL
jgi:N-formylglutamate amidohydrolase